MCSLLSQNEEKSTTINFDDIKYFSVQVMLKFSSGYKNAFLQFQIVYADYILFLEIGKKQMQRLFIYLQYSISALWAILLLLLFFK